MNKKNLIGICGSANTNSSSLSILKWITELEKFNFNIEIVDTLTELPHFKTELTDNNTPQKIVDFRNKITNADGIIFCTPEYIFSIPSGLKNMIEWCVSTIVFDNKPLGIITASTNGEKGHEELKLIMKTLQGNFTEDATLLISGVKGKINNEGKIIDNNTETELLKFMQSFKSIINN